METIIDVSKIREDIYWLIQEVNRGGSRDEDIPFRNILGIVMQAIYAFSRGRACEYRFRSECTACAIDITRNKLKSNLIVCDNGHIRVAIDGVNRDGMLGVRNMVKKILDDFGYPSIGGVVYCPGSATHTDPICPENRPSE